MTKINYSRMVWIFMLFGLLLAAQPASAREQTVQLIVPGCGG